MLGRRWLCRRPVWTESGAQAPAEYGCRCAVRSRLTASHALEMRPASTARLCDAVAAGELRWPLGCGGVRLPSSAKAVIEGVSRELARPAEHASPDSALRWVLRILAESPSAASARVWVSDDPGSGVHLYPLDPRGDVLVVGDSPLADLAREQLPQHGWRIRPMPQPGTPLIELRPHLSARTFNILAREGFTIVEQVAELPDRTFFSFRHLGVPTLESVRRALATVRTHTYPADAGVTLDATQVRELAELLGILGMYAQARGQDDVRRRAEAFAEVLRTLASTTPAESERAQTGLARARPPG